MKIPFYFSLFCCALFLSGCGNHPSPQQEEDLPIEEKTVIADTVKPVIVTTQQQKLAQNHIVRAQTMHDGEITAVYRYNADGSTQKEDRDNGRYVTEYTYNDKGLLTSKKTFEEKSLYSERKYEYNTKGLLIKETYSVVEKGKTELADEYFYAYSKDTLRSIHRINHASEYEEKTVYKYAADGSLEAKDVLFSNKQTASYLSERTSYQYQPGTRLPTGETWDSYEPDGKKSLSCEIEYTQNAAGDPLTKVNHAMGITQRYSYEYNDKGLISKETMYNPQNTIVTEYVYFTK